MTKNKTAPGVFKAVKKNGSVYYRASLTFKGRHISLGSFETEASAAAAYTEGSALLSSGNREENERLMLSYPSLRILPYEKFISLLNFKDNGIYAPNPIYIRRSFIEYHLCPGETLKFDRDDLFYFSSHKIMKRGGHYFAADYGLQVNILNRFGIKNYAVKDRDYYFINGDNTDFRRSNIEIVNRYNGVSQKAKKGKTVYRAVIHIKGNFIIGDYEDEITAAIAYNKAADILKKNGISKAWEYNDIADIDELKLKQIYDTVKISEKIISLNNLQN